MTGNIGVDSGIFGEGVCSVCGQEGLLCCPEHHGEHKICPDCCGDALDELWHSGDEE